MPVPPSTASVVEVSIVIPCRNEAGTIGTVVREAAAALMEHGYAGEVIVCDNRSSDGSADEARAAGARVVTQWVRGYGAACLAGLEAASGRWLVLVDGDGTYGFAELPRFVEPLRAGYDLVLGTRRNGTIESAAMRRRHRHLLEPVQTALSRRFLPFQVSDVRCGYRAVSREALGRLSLGATGAEFASEMVLAAAKAGCDVVEVPVTFRARPGAGSRRSLGDGWRVVRQLLLLSPTRLFLVPGLLLAACGLGMELALVGGPVRVGGVTFDFHFMFVGGALTLLGLQLLLLGLFAKTWVLVHEPAFADRWIAWFHSRYTLERAVGLGAAVFLVGLGINLWILWDWLSNGRGDLFAVRPAMLAMTLLLAGAELVFGSFFLSLLRGRRYGRP
jgi:glycosyltransferase involved in cell wall biosynthesis